MGGYFAAYAPPFTASGGVISPAAGITQWRFPVGTDAAPGLAADAAPFNDGITGLGGDIGVSVDGTNRLRVSAGVVQATGVGFATTAAGTAGSPAFRHATNGDGIYFPVDDQVSIAVGGEEQGRFDATALGVDETAFTLRNNDGGAGEALDRVLITPAGSTLQI